MSRAANNGQQHQIDSARAAEPVPAQTIYEMIEESSYRFLEHESPTLLSYVKELVRLGASPEGIVERISVELQLPRWRVAYLGCAGAYLHKLNSVQVEGRTS